MYLVRSFDPEQACDGDLAAVVFEVTWALHFLGEILSKYRGDSSIQFHVRTLINAQVFVLPWLIVTGLQMKTSLKVGVYCTFLLGLINIAFCLSRFIIIMLANTNDSVSFIGK